MNPHYGDYYQKGHPPADYLDPNPILFPAVKKGTRFLFTILVRDTSVNLRLSKEQLDESFSRIEEQQFTAEELAKQATELLQKALSARGAGGKTRTDYGYFSSNAVPL